LVVRSTAASPSASQVPLTSAAVEPSAGTFDVQFEVEPATAAVEIDGIVTGTGTFARAFPRGSRHVVRVLAPGYEPQTIPFDETSLPPTRVVLRAAEVAPVQAAPPVASQEIDLPEEPSP